MPVLATMHVLGRFTVAITAYSETTGTVPERQMHPGIASIHFSLRPHALRTPSPEDDSEGHDAASTASSIEVAQTSTSPGVESFLHACQPMGNEAAVLDSAAVPVGSPGIEGTPQTRSGEKIVPWVMTMELDDQAAVLSSCFAKLSEECIRCLQRRMLQHPKGFCDSDDFPSELLTVESLRAALVAGFAADSTWLDIEKAAVLDMLLAFDSRHLLSQVGMLALVRSSRWSYVWPVTSCLLLGHVPGCMLRVSSQTKEPACLLCTAAHRAQSVCKCIHLRCT